MRGTSLNRLAYLQRGPAVILTGIGLEMLLGAWIKLPVVATLAFVLTVLAVSIAWAATGQLARARNRARTLRSTSTGTNCVTRAEDISP